MNNLQQHMQVHQPRNVRCPLCGNQRFRNAANAVQHVESGYCTSCLGQSNARSQVFNFIQSHDRTRSLLSNDALRIQNGGQWDGTVPEVPYACNYCRQRFRQLSQMTQHEAAKHPHVRGSNPVARNWILVILNRGCGSGFRKGPVSEFKGRVALLGGQFMRTK
mmetsp:Transcript_3463/g.5511  ORF Transcript_3463/g.5511 Transcript_3463/m.5511 type:complete len:163 (-) Transcript_3463:444-932(-)